MKKVLLAFSGGIDSTHAARVLQRQGYAVTAMTLDTVGDTVMLANAEAKARALGIDFFVEDVRTAFSEKVERYFSEEYLRGRTPAPCTVCNAEIKWKVLYEKAIAGGFDHIATGHYFNLVRRGGFYYVSCAADKVKDQSYYLWMLPQEILAMALTPMGDTIKREVVEKLPGGESRKESMGVCFLNGRGCGQYLMQKFAGSPTLPGAMCPGDIVDSAGTVVGRHSGVAFYTIGQKKGLEFFDGVSLGQAVVSVDAQANRIVVGSDERLLHCNLIVNLCTFVDPQEIFSASDISVKVRGIGRNPDGFCRILPHGDRAHIILDDPAWAPAPGQPVVLYRGSDVVGGGFLERSF